MSPPLPNWIAKKVVLVEDGKPVAAIEDMVANTGKFRHLGDLPPNLQKINEMRIYPDRAKLVAVIDRTGNRYGPPCEHLGLAMEDNGPIAVATLMVRYIEAMISDAQTLIVES